ncbi:hypothetical protein NW762_007481 [Fusarium torreyae]|uniref:Zn(2)-C6 fungal-type domain-containing protein n=1 Tax=Fusarium torreyae TaxID=1237075 RepID=A0A9W8S0W9_9HYPO|nr:hypothetical protein NW762_007481 [Fusarium torreyae]
MYAPVPARVKKTDITRSRNGCARCRSKRRKCDEAKPICTRCVSAGSRCEYDNASLKFREATKWAADKVDHRLANLQAQSRRRSTRGRSPASTPQRPLIDDVSCDHDEVVHHSIIATPQLATENDGYLGAHTPASGSGAESMTLDRGFTDDVLPSPHATSRWSGSEMNYLDFDFDLALANCDSNDSLDHFVDFPDVMDDVSLTHIPWDYSESQLQQTNATLTGLSRQQNHPYPNSTTVDVKLDRIAASQQPTPGLTQEQQTPDDSQSSSLASPGPVSLQESSPWSQISKPPPTCKIEASHRLYLAHFKVTVAKSFPVQLASLWKLVMQCESVYYAALALAAANLANTQGQHSDDDQGTWIASPKHVIKANAFAKRGIAALDSGPVMPFQARLVTMFLVIYYELEADSVSNGWHALSILNATIRNRHEDISSLPEGDVILQWWLHLRSFTASSASAHRPYITEDPMGEIVGQLERKFATPSQMINLVGIKGQQIWHRILLIECFRESGETPDQVLKAFGDWWNIMKGNHVDSPEGPTQDTRGFMDEDELYAELNNLKTTLRSCEPPKEFQSSLLEGQDGCGDPKNLEPLTFSSHRQAMEIVDFAFAQFICESSLLKRLINPEKDQQQQFPDEESTSIEHSSPWVRLILRTALGLDLSKCGRENAFRRGIVCFLFYLGLFVPGGVSYQFLSNIVQGMIDTHTHSEGPFYPLHGFIGFFKTLKQEMIKGRNVFVACIAHDEWATKDRLFSKGSNEHLIVYGRERNGQYFNDLIPTTED